MRKREDIDTDFIITSIDMPKYQMKLLLEVLLDIRDLLIEHDSIEQ